MSPALALIKRLSTSLISPSPQWSPDHNTLGVRHRSDIVAVLHQTEREPLSLESPLSLIKSSWGLTSLSLLALSLLMIKSAVADDRISGLSSMGSPAQVKHIIPHEIGDENYVEKYTFDASLRAAGTAADSEWTGRIYYSISISNIGAGDHNVTAKGSIKIGSERYRWQVKKSEDEWRRARNKLDVKIGGVRLYGDLTTLHLEAKTKEGEMKVTLKPIAQPWRPGEGGLRTSDRKQVDFTLLPINEINGSFKLKGQQEVSVTGIGWGQHSWSHLGPHEWSKWTYQTRVFDPDKRRALFVRQVKSGGDYQIGYFSYALLFDGAKRVFEGYSLKTDVQKKYTDKSHDNRYTFPTQFVLNGVDVRDQSVLKARFKTTKRHYHRNPIAKYSWVKRKVIEAVTEPMIYAYQVDYQVEVSGARQFEMSGENGRFEAYFLND